MMVSYPVCEVKRNLVYSKRKRKYFFATEFTEKHGRNPMKRKKSIQIIFHFCVFSVNFRVFRGKNNWMFTV
jgi:hypothetical protein